MKRFMWACGDKAICFVGHCDCEVVLEHNLLDDLGRDGYSVEIQDVELGAIENNCVVIPMPFGGEDLDVIQIWHYARRAEVTRYRVGH